MENKRKYKILFSDLDHTLLIGQNIPPFNLEAINKLKEKGVKFVICTGRSFDLMSHLLKELNTEDAENEYTICNSGSTIYENKNRKLLFFKGVDNEVLNLVFEYGKKINDILIIFEAFDKAYVFNEELIDKERWKGFKYQVMQNIDDLKNDKIIRILFHAKEHDYLLKIQEDIKNNKIFEGNISYYMSSKFFLEINSFGICKGAALKWLSNYLNVDVKDTIAIGDDFNDESMIKEAGLGCCVKSAHDDIKKISKYICEWDYFEGSVKEVIEKFILN
jgi:Cof subfamily protein (haloacid dehalogenase superfamily)